MVLAFDVLEMIKWNWTGYFNTKLQKVGHAARELAPHWS